MPYALESRQIRIDRNLQVSFRVCGGKGKVYHEAGRKKQVSVGRVSRVKGAEGRRYGRYYQELMSELSVNM